MPELPDRLRIARAFLEQLRADGVTAAVAHGNIADLDRRTGDLDLLVDHDAARSARSATRLTEFGCYVTSVWPSDVDTVNVIVHESVSRTSLQIDLVHSTEGRVGYGTITKPMIDASRFDERQGVQHLSEEDGILYLVSKALVKGQQERLRGLLGSEEVTRLGVRALVTRARAIFEPRTASRVIAAIGGGGAQTRELAWLSGNLPGARRDAVYVVATLSRLKRRVRLPVGSVVQLPSGQRRYGEILAQQLSGAAHRVELPQGTATIGVVARRYKSYIGILAREDSLAGLVRPDIKLESTATQELLHKLNDRSLRLLCKYETASDVSRGG